MSFITLTEGKDLIATYVSQRSSMLNENYTTATLPLCITFTKSEIYDLIAQDGCDAIRVYFGMDEEDLIQLVIVGVDESGDDIIPTQDYLIVDRGLRCPTDCPDPSPLTS